MNLLKATIGFVLLGLFVGHAMATGSAAEGETFPLQLGATGEPSFGMTLPTQRSLWRLQGLAASPL
jgi:hypothetical protein